MRLWPQKWFEVKIFTSNNFRVRHAEREREREREPSMPANPEPRSRPTLDASVRSRRRVRTAEIVPPRSSAPLFLFLTRSWSTLSLPISFSLLIGAVVTDLVLVLDPKLIGAADLVVSISSHQWSCRLNLVSISSSSLFPWSFRSLFLPPSLSLTKFVWRVWKF